MFYVYILQSETDDGLYIGFTTDLRLRLKQHQAGESFATSYRGPWKLIYYEAYLDERDALGRERYLKSGGGRRFLKSLLKHHLIKHPLKRAASSSCWPRGAKRFTRATHLLENGYVNEFAFRFNNRELEMQDLFSTVVQRVSNNGKMSYKILTA